MSKNIVGFLGSLDAVSKFFEEQEREQKEFSRYSENDPTPFYNGNGKQRGHVVHTEDDSITQQMRGY